VYQKGYNIQFVNRKVKEIDNAASCTGVPKLAPVFTLKPPGGWPSVMEGRTTVDVEVTTTPWVSVMMNVTNEGAGDTVGSAVTLFRCEVPNTGRYVLVARPEETICPTVAGTEVLKA
jgi:hypothetical protein